MGIQSNEKSSSRNGTIDFLRILFILIIILFHGGKNFNDGVTTFRLFRSGSLSVEFFFLVSGYLMVCSASKRMRQGSVLSVGRETQRFIVHKAVRLLPDYYVGYVFAFLAFAFAHHYGVLLFIKNLMFSVFGFLFLGQSGVYRYEPNGVAWYFSAMMIAMAVLYPLLIRKRELFLHWIAPLIAIFIYGYLYQVYGKWGFSNPTEWTGLMMHGLLRGFAGISLGCTAYMLNSKVADVELTVAGRRLLTVIEALAYLVPIAIMETFQHSEWDYITLFSLFVGVMITFSNKSYSPEIFRAKIWNTLGVFSLDLMISHAYWSIIFGEVVPQWSYQKTMVVYLCVSFVNALLVYFISLKIKKCWPGLLASCKRRWIQS